MSVEVVAFTVPGQPQGKGRPRAVRIAGHTALATPQKTVAYEGLIAHVAHQAMAGRPMTEEAVIVGLSVDCQVPQSWSQRKQRQALANEIKPKTKPDVDNVVKAVFDGMNGVVWRDDVQVVELTLRKRYATTPCVRVSVMEAA